MSYDKNGNIIDLQRNGRIYADIQEIDNLIYNYDGNRLMKVTDSSNSPQGFNDGFNQAGVNDYSYDDNGNMIVDNNKDIKSIIYNHLNLPTQINFGNGNRIIYLYNAVGQKVNKNVRTGNEYADTDYLGGFQYRSSYTSAQGDQSEATLQYFPMAEGYIEHKEGRFFYIYHYTDHLGNIRLSYTYDENVGMIRIMEENHYYPFGLKHESYNTQRLGYTEFINEEEVSEFILGEQPKFVGDGSYAYKYNGKELQDELGLNMYSMDMRQYDPAIGRWVLQDPVIHHSMSPYNAFDNNPVYWADPSGADAVYNWGTENYEDNGEVVDFATAMASHGLNTSGDPIKKKTTTDAGHGIDGTSNSAVDPGAIDGTHYEKDYALLIEEQVNNWLTSWNIDNSRTRTGDLTIDENSLNYRWKLANKHGSVVFVSFHLNSGTGDEVFGVYQQGKNNESGSKELAAYIFSNLSLMNVSSNNTRAVKGFTRFNTLGTLNNFKGDAGLLIELGGIGSESNRNNIKNNANEIGKQIATGIYQYLYDGNKPPAPKPFVWPEIAPFWAN